MCRKPNKKKILSNFFLKPSVSELMGWVRNVVVINVYLDLENPGGSGFRVGGYPSYIVTF